MNIQIHQPQAIYEQGRRQNQEDALFPLCGQARADSRVFVVCDGIGGFDKGEVASAVVCQTLGATAEALMAANDGMLTDEHFNQALAKSYDALEAAEQEHHERMGTTMTFLCLHRGGCLAAHLGDSRIYHLRPKTGEVLYRSTDHSLVQRLYEMGEISYSEMRTSPRRNIIIKAMLSSKEKRHQATVAHITDIQPGDYFYLCTDGMLQSMDDDELIELLRAKTSDEEKARELRQRTAQNSDNHTAYLIRVRS